MADPLIIAYIGIGGTLAGTFLGSLLGSWIARRTVREQFFYSSAAKLKQSFVDVLRCLKEPEDRFEIITEWTIDAMDSCFPEHERSVTEFAYALPEKERARLYDAWEKYRGKELGNDKFRKRYLNRRCWQQEALKDIETLLAFTELPHISTLGSTEI